MIRGGELPLFLEGVYIPGRPDLAAGSLEHLRVAVRLFGRWLGGTPSLTDLTTPALLSFMRHLVESGRSPATANSKRQGLLAIWNAAAEEGLCSPPGKIPKLREPKRIPVAWTIGELERIFRATEGLTGQWAGIPIGLCWRVALLTFWDTGCRLAVVLRARLTDIDLEARTLFAPAEHIKGRRQDRIFPLHAQTVAVIRQSLPSNRRKLFPFPWKRRQVWRHLKRLLRSAGLPSDRTRMFHCLRRTASSYAAAERGISWSAAAIGHSEAVAKASYVSPMICRPPALIEALPRPRLT